jgi:glycosyltransferase involved in cell wall biosynthesis
MRRNSLKKWRRSLRLSLAPVGSPRDRWLRDKIRKLSKLRQGSWQSHALQLLPQFVADPMRMRFRKRRIEMAKQYRLQMDMIIRNYKNIDNVIVFPPSLDWNVQLFQRPQQLALALAEKGVLVFYVMPKTNQDAKSFEQYRENLYLCNVPIETFALIENPLIYLLTWNRAYATVFQDPKIIYDYVDDIQVFDGDYDQMVRDHERLVKEAYLVLTTAEPLFESTKKIRADALLCPNGVDYSHFDAARNQNYLKLPNDLKVLLDRGNPIVGYYGALAEWFDYTLVTQLAKMRPDITFLLIGPDYDGTMHPSFLEVPNIAWFGVKPYQELPIYLSHFDVAMIPFLLNEITHATSPLKLFEYMAAGKPVIVTPMHESMRYDGVLVADSPDAFSNLIDRALELRNEAEFKARIDLTARQNTWQARADQILTAMGQIG